MARNQIHIYHLARDGSIAGEYTSYDKKNIFFNKKFSSHPKDYKYNAAATSLTIKFSLAIADPLISALATSGQDNVAIYVDQILICAGILIVQKITLTNYQDIDPRFVKVVDASFLESNPMLTMLSELGKTSGYTFINQLNSEVPFTNFMTKMASHYGFSLAGTTPITTLKTQLKSLTITRTIPAASWSKSSCGLESHVYHSPKPSPDEQSYLRNKKWWEIWTININGLAGMQPSSDTVSAFYLNSGNLDTHGDIRCAENSTKKYTWNPQYSMNYSFYMKGFSLATGDEHSDDNRKHYYTFGVTIITAMEERYWSHNTYYGACTSCDIHIPSIGSNEGLVQTGAPICRKEDLSPPCIVGAPYTDIILWIGGRDYDESNADDDDDHEYNWESSDVSGSADIELRRLRTELSSTSYFNAMGEAKNQDILEIVCRDKKCILSIDPVAKTIGFNQSLTPLTITIFQEPVSYEWKIIRITIKRLDEPFFIQDTDGLPPDPESMNEEYDYKYYQMTFTTILSVSQFADAKNGTPLHINIGGIINSNYILSEIKNWRPESGLCTIVAFDNSIREDKLIKWNLPYDLK